MDKSSRLEKIVHAISSSEKPVSGTQLAKLCNVSRQVIVQDIALLRAKNIDILSTHKGYVLLQTRKQRIFKVFHKENQIEEELHAIVDLGGRVENVFVEHPVYGRLEASMNLATRKDVQVFMEQVASKDFEPLTSLTSGVHSHVVSACREDVLDEIERTLSKMNILYAEG